MNEPVRAAAPVHLEGVEVWRSAEEPAVVRGAALSIAAGERVFLLGPNGAGKTSLLLAVVGATRFTGTIRVGSLAVGPRSLDEVRRRVGFVFADPRDQFFLDRVEDEVAFGPRERGLDAGTVAARVDAALGAVDLDGLRGRAPDTLSLGEQRRLALATMLAVQPEVLLLDEPTASLDPRARRRLLGVLAALPSTVVVATHDLDAAYELGGRAVLMDQGRIVAEGDARRLVSDTAQLEQAGLELPLAARAHGRP